jgi:acyl carrier protein
MCDVRGKITRLLKDKYGADQLNEVTAETCVLVDLKLTDLQLVELVMELEAQFSVEIDDSDLYCITRIGALADYVWRRMPATAPKAVAARP